MAKKVLEYKRPGAWKPLKIVNGKWFFPKYVVNLDYNIILIYYINNLILFFLFQEIC